MRVPLDGPGVEGRLFVMNRARPHPLLTPSDHRLEGGIPDISVVIPVRNEQDNVAALIDETLRALEGRCEFEVLFVDDGSDDATLEVLRVRARRYTERIRILRHAESCGQSAAIHSGVLAARHPLIVMLDGDGQNDPVDIPRLVKPLTGAGPKVDMTIGRRELRQDSWNRRLSSRIANGVRSRLLHDGIPDAGCGIRAIRRDTYLALPYFDHMHRFMPALVQRGGGRVEAIVVRHRPRKHGRSKYGIRNRLWAGIVDLFGVRWLQRRVGRPSEVIEESVDGC
jgi:dolichol-phosphate mannosyltransferase